MAKQFSEVNSLNIVFMFKCIFCNTQLLTSVIVTVRLTLCLQGLQYILSVFG